MSKEWKFRILTTRPGGEEIREEGKVNWLLGEGLIGTRTAPNIHFVIDSEGEACIGVSNPVVGGPVVLCREQREKVLIPDVLEHLKREPVTIILKQAEKFQLIFLDPI